MVQHAPACQRRVLLAQIEAASFSPKRKRKYTQPIWNKGLTKHTDERMAKIGRSIAATQQRNKVIGTYVHPTIGAEARARLSLRQTLHNVGGKSRWYDVHGQRVQGGWERDVANTFQRVGIAWRKCAGADDVIEYVLDGRKRRYTPDFYLPDLDIWIEVKGYWWNADRAKMRAVCDQRPQFAKRLVILTKEPFEKFCALASQSEVLIFLQSVLSLHGEASG